MSDKEAAREEREIADIEKAMDIKIGDVLGQGAFGKVFKGTMTKTGAT